MSVAPDADERLGQSQREADARRGRVDERDAAQGAVHVVVAQEGLLVVPPPDGAQRRAARTAADAQALVAVDAALDEAALELALDAQGAVQDALGDGAAVGRRADADDGDEDLLDADAPAAALAARLVVVGADAVPAHVLLGRDEALAAEAVELPHEFAPAAAGDCRGAQVEDGARGREGEDDGGRQEAADDEGGRHEGQGLVGREEGAEGREERGEASGEGVGVGGGMAAVGGGPGGRLARWREALCAPASGDGHAPEPGGR